MKRQTFFVLIICCAAIVMLAETAAAEIAIEESIEWVVADSDAVVMGTVTKVEMVGADKGTRYEVATVTVAKTFLGKELKTVKFIVPNFNGKLAEGWLKSGQPMIFCLLINGKNEDTIRYWAFKKKYKWALRSDGCYLSAIHLDEKKRKWSGTTAVCTMDGFKILSKKEDIIKIVGKIAKAAPKGKKPEFHHLDVPFDTDVYKSFYGGSSVWLKVPVNKHLEAMGRKLCRTLYPHGGVKILARFKNDENIKILKGLLNDPNCGTSTRSVSDSTAAGGMRQVYKKKVYYVRKTAYEALKKWGVNARRPLMEILLAGKAKVLDCTISSEKKVYKLGEVPKIDVKIKNIAKKDIYLVGSLDASDCRWRYPYCFFEVIGPDGKSALKGMGRCGLYNQLRKEDFIKVSAKKSFNPFMHIDGGGFFSAYEITQKETFAKPGKYRIRFIYSADSKDISQWGSWDKKKTVELMEMFKQIPKIAIMSNEITVEIIKK